MSEAAGVEWITPHILHRKEREMQAAQARAILAQAKSTESYEGPIPEDDEKAVSEAQALVEMAQVAWEQHVRGPEVEAILRLAADEFDGSQNGHPESEPEEAIGEGEPEAEPDSDLTEAPSLEARLEKYRQVEPWTGYADEKDKAIREALAIGIEAEENPADLLAHVWAYEKAHKGRQRILNLVEELADKIKEESDEPTEAPDGGGEAPDAEAAVEAPAGEGTAREADSDGDGGEAEAHADVPAPERPEPVAQGEAAPVGSDHAGEPEAGTPQDRGQEAEVELDYSDLVSEVEEELARHRLHVPEPPTEDPPTVPYDFSKISDKDLQSLHTIFAMFAYRANYLLMKHERIALALKMQADEIHRELLVAIAKYDDKGKEKKVTVLEAEIESTPRVKKLRHAQRKHEIYATAHRQERDSYNKLVEAMSRLETMRQNEYERSRR